MSKQIGKGKFLEKVLHLPTFVSGSVLTQSHSERLAQFTWSIRITLDLHACCDILRVGAVFV
jgi:hypothetical protein